MFDRNCICSDCKLIRELQAEQELTDFLAGYLECALWADLDTGNEQETGTGAEWPDWIDRVPAETMDKLRKDCADFLTANLADVREYCDVLGDWHGNDGSTPAAMARAGHDFWLTRNGHGAGFWDRGLGALGERLTNAAEPYGAVYLYVGSDGKVWT